MREREVERIGIKQSKNKEKTHSKREEVKEEILETK